MLKRDSTRYTILFATAVCVVCALLVSVAAVTLQPRQAASARLYMEKNVLLAAGLLESGVDVTPAEVNRIFDERIKVRLVDLATGELVPEDKVDARGYDQRKARGDPAASRVAPPNNAGIGRLPNLGVVYFIMKGDVVDQVVIPIEGLGLWGTIYGFLVARPRHDNGARAHLLRPEGDAGPRRRDRQPEVAGAVAGPQGVRRAVERAHHGHQRPGWGAGR